MILLSEAQGVPDHAWEAASACATDSSNVICCVGNPIHRDGKLEAASVRWPSVRFNALEVVGLGIPGAASQAWVDEVAEEWGTDSDWYRVHVLGLFPVDDSDTALVTRAMLDRAVALHRGEDVVPPGRWAFSLDPSEGQNDASVLAALKGDGHLVKLHTWHGANAVETRDRIIEILATYQCVPPADLRKFAPGDVRGPRDFDLIVDSVAFGSGVADILEEAGFTVTRFKSSHKPSDALDGDSMFYDKRAECYWRLRLQLQAGTLALPDHPALFEELLNTRWGLTDNEKIKIEQKKLIKARIGRSPDHADAVMQALAPANKCTGLAVMVDL